MSEKPLDYFLRMLIEGKVNFSDLFRVYVGYLENKDKQSRNQIVEAGVLLTMHNEPKLNQGTKKQLKDRTIKAIKHANIWDGSEERSKG